MKYKLAYECKCSTSECVYFMSSCECAFAGWWWWFQHAIRKKSDWAQTRKQKCVSTCFDIMSIFSPSLAFIFIHCYTATQRVQCMLILLLFLGSCCIAQLTLYMCVRWEYCMYYLSLSLESIITICQYYMFVVYVLSSLHIYIIHTTLHMCYVCASKSILCSPQKSSDVVHDKNVHGYYINCKVLRTCSNMHALQNIYIYYAVCGCGCVCSWSKQYID